MILAERLANVRCRYPSLGMIPAGIASSAQGCPPLTGICFMPGRHATEAEQPSARTPGMCECVCVCRCRCLCLCQCMCLCLCVCLCAYACVCVCACVIVRARALTRTARMCACVCARACARVHSRVRSCVRACARACACVCVCVCACVCVWALGAVQDSASSTALSTASPPLWHDREDRLYRLNTATLRMAYPCRTERAVRFKRCCADWSHMWPRRPWLPVATAAWPAAVGLKPWQEHPPRPPTPYLVNDVGHFPCRRERTVRSKRLVAHRLIVLRVHDGNCFLRARPPGHRL